MALFPKRHAQERVMLGRQLVSCVAAAALVMAASSVVAQQGAPAASAVPAPQRAPAGNAIPAPPRGIVVPPLGAGPFVYQTAENQGIRVVVHTRGLVRPWSLVWLPSG